MRAEGFRELCLHAREGRVRYDVELTYVAQENVSTSGGYSGPTTKCEMRYKQIAGFKQTPQVTASRVQRAGPS